MNRPHQVRPDGTHSARWRCFAVYGQVPKLKLQGIYALTKQLV
jgi:hypothetical protein